MFFGFDSTGMKVWIGFILSMVILVCTSVSTPLCQALLNRIAFDDVVWVKVLIVSVLLCIFLLSLLGAKQPHASSIKQMKKVLRWQASLNDLEKLDWSVGLKKQFLNKLFGEMRSDLDLVVHYPQEFTQIEIGDDYGTSIEILKRVLEVYSKTLSDEYYRSKYYSTGGANL